MHRQWADTTPPTTESRRSPAARAHRAERAAAHIRHITGGADRAIAAARAEVNGLTAALADLDAEHPAVPGLEARLDRARGRLRAWLEAGECPRIGND
ncbi:hypothetical protein MOPEL_030_00040 [Mobilicoccus pelagius NBRC 104925]|uniref:Uncharacterized protein n=1 Tax=Mobilicoccus pelagius NBRC 104925 TaxID=1089455 RepID=H5UQ86_9MICO|nr:hypothetical protein MOPEL_030_00040 [Mobilicoccus pelagius NBRC 104925]